jgi:hypothetical protein
MISLHRNHDTAASRFVTTRPSTLDKIKKTLPSCSVQFDRYFVAEHKPFEPSPHHLVSQILFLFGRRNEMWVKVRFQGGGRQVGAPMMASAC